MPHVDTTLDVARRIGERVVRNGTETRDCRLLVQQLLPPRLALRCTKHNALSVVATTHISLRAFTGRRVDDAHEIKTK